MRANNTVQYILPNGIFGPGLYGQVMVAAGEAAPANKYFGGRIGYAAGPFDVAAAYGDTDVDVAATSSSPTGTSAVRGTSAWSSCRASTARWTSAAWLAVMSSRTTGSSASAAPIAQWNVKASYGQVKQSGNVVDGNKANQFAIGADYNLSKRTAIYATYGSIQNTNTAYSVSATGSLLTRGNNSNGAEFGIRHSF